MKLKIFLLTITISFLGFLSSYFIFQDLNYSKISESSENNSNQSISSGKLSSDQAAFILPVVESTFFPLRDWNVLEPEIGAKAAAVFDSRSGKILFQKNIKTPLPIASITKLLTAMITVENLDLNLKIFVPKEAVNADNEGGADLFLNEEIMVGDLLRMLLIKSSNDSAVSLRMLLEERGIDMISAINLKAESVGMSGSKFYDSAGLNDDGYSTVEDLIKLAQYVKRYPKIQDTLLTKNAKIKSADGRFSHDLETTNKLLGIVPDIEFGKTGYTDGALGTMVLMVKLPAHESSLIVVVLGSSDRFGDIQRLIDWAKSAHRWE